MNHKNTTPDLAKPDSIPEFDYDTFIAQLDDLEARKQEPKPITYDILNAKIHLIKTPLRNLFSDTGALFNHLGMYVGIPIIVGLVYRLFFGAALVSGQGISFAIIAVISCIAASLLSLLYSTLLLMNVGFGNFQTVFTAAERQIILKEITKNVPSFWKYIALNQLMPAVLFAMAFGIGSFFQSYYIPFFTIVGLSTYLVALFHGRLKRVSLSQISKVGYKF